MTIFFDWFVITLKLATNCFKNYKGSITSVSGYTFKNGLHNSTRIKILFPKLFILYIWLFF